MFQAETPLHKVRCMELSVRYGGDRDGRKTRCRIRLRGRTGKLALRKSQCEGSIGGHGCVNRAAGNSRRNRCAADSAKEAPLERFDVGWIARVHASAR